MPSLVPASIDGWYLCCAGVDALALSLFPIKLAAGQSDNISMGHSRDVKTPALT